MAHFRRKFIKNIARPDGSNGKQLEDRARKTVLVILLAVTVIILGLLLLMLLISYYIDGNRHIYLRILVNLVVLAFVLSICILVKYRQYSVGSVMLVGFYGAVALASMWQWGIHIAFAILITSFTITLAGILLGARFSLLVGGIFIGTLLFIQTLIALHVHIPDSSWQTGLPSEYGEAIGYCLLFAMLTVTSWIFGRQTEIALIQSRQAKAALVDQKKLLAKKLKERTDKLRISQLQEMQQLYQFAELGHISTTLFHELANRLSVLSLDVENLKKPSGAHAIANVDESIAYIDRLVFGVRQQLRQDEHPRIFSASHNIQDTCNSLQSLFKETGVGLTISISSPTEKSLIYGDPIRFGQAITILITNALDASRDVMVSSSNITNSNKLSVLISVSSSNDQIAITVKDWGVGIPSNAKSKIFKAFYGTKKDGMGIGLFMTKQIIETHFHGKIFLSHSKQPTEFSVHIPLRST